MVIEKKIEYLVERAIKKSHIFAFLMSILRKFGISQFVRRIWLEKNFKKDTLKPNEQMTKSTVYFKEHKADISRIVKLLEDKESKRTYKRAILYRCTHNVKKRPKYNMKNQYFPKDIISISSDEVFIDCGAFTGDTIDTFKKYSNNSYKKVVCFEPDTMNYKQLVKKSLKDKRIVAIQSGVWNCNTILSFSNDGSSASSVQEADSGIKIEVSSIDSTEECKDATFIKMDIEGSEYEALNGAVETIKRNKPKLAICIYHSDEDFIRLIDWINGLEMGYKFYVRHHSFDICETVVYAI